MKKIIALLFLMLAACAQPIQEEHKEHQTSYNIMKVHSGTNYTTKVHDLTITFEPELHVGKESHLMFTLENEQGQVQLTEHHGAPMHIIMVSKDLNQFYHLHPEFEGPSKLDSHKVFDTPGEYRVWIDFIYQDMNHIIDYDVTVTE